MLLFSGFRGIMKEKEADMSQGMSERVKKLGFLDIAFIKFSVFFATVLIVKLFPQLLNLRILSLLILIVGFGILPFYKFWFKK